MKISTKTSFEDHFDLLEAKLRQFDDIEISAGFYDGTPHYDKDGTAENTVATIASRLEYGTKNMEERPFMRTASAQYKNTAIKKLGRILSRVLNGSSIDLNSNFNRIAKELKDQIKATIDSPPASFPKLSEYTLKLKEPETRMFYDTGQMVANLSCKVEKGSKE